MAGDQEVQYDYSDDPIQEERVRGNRFHSLIVILAVVVLSFGAKGVLAANINLNAGGTVEFGQGILLTTGCSGANVISVKPKSAFTNSSGAGAYKLSGFVVTGVPSGCQDNLLYLSAYGDSDSTKLDLYNTSKNTVSVRYQAGSFSIEENTSGISLSNVSSGAFTVTFTTPVSLATASYKVTLESSTLTQLYKLGSTGPGGGLVFYYNAAGFQSNGVTAHYLEAAPKSWQGAGMDPGKIWSIASESTTSVSGLSESIGSGYSNSVTLVNRGNDVTTAVGKARAYAGGGLTDWFLPSFREFNELCKYAFGQASVSEATLCSSSGTLNSGISDTNFQLQINAYWLSNEYSATNGLYYYTSTAYKGNNPKSYSYPARAIRAF